MALKAIFPPGQAEITVNGLHQWDYGRQLEIYADGLPALVEVHFACAGMTEAVVRSCDTTSGVTTAAIPDRCMEQTSPIIAWIYAVGDTKGETIKTITLPITARTRPAPSATIPEDISDKYTETVGAINGVIEQLTNGSILVSEAAYAYSAWEAQHAKGAELAATADHATTADKAHRDSEGRDLRTLMSCDEDGWTPYAEDPTAVIVGVQGGLMSFKIVRTVDGNSDTRVFMDVGGTVYNTHYSSIFYDEITGGHTPGVFPLRLVLTPGTTPGDFRLSIQYYNGTWLNASSDIYPKNVYYKHLVKYSVG